MSRLFLLLGCLTTLLVCDGAAQAQRRTPNYRNRPVLSPYTSLFRGDNGGLNSYFSVVRPRLALNQYIQEADYEFRAQQQQMDQRSLYLQQELDEQLQGSSLMMRPTGSTGAMRRPAGSFMNYSNYYRSGAGTSLNRSRSRR